MRAVTTALRKVAGLPFATVANGHGPLLRYNVPELVGRYRAWSEAAGKGETQVAVRCTSDWVVCYTL